MKAFAARALLTMALGALTAGASADEPKSEAKTVSLFNGRDLSGWSIFIRHADKSDPTKDPKGVFKVEDGVIHISGEEFGGITTDKEYENYRLTVEFKWGTKKWPPRENAVRDSGILVHCVGPAKVWTKSIECQIQEHDCGDFWMVDGTSITVDGKVERQRKIKKTDGEKPTGEWNTVEVVCEGDKITNIVNGVTVNHGTNASVTKGKILLQSEGAEVFYRKVELRPLN
jgi:3-keto-disaccharide hydrolase